MPSSRPRAVTILAALEFGGGLASVALGLYYVNVLDGIVAELGLAPSNAPDFYTFFIIEAVLGLVALPLGYGLLSGKKWGWTFTGDYSAASLVYYVGFGSYFVAQYGDYTEISSGVVGLLVAVVAALYLSRPSVKGFFQDSRGDVPVPVETPA